MSLYELLLFLHIAAAIVWIGSGTLINLQAWRAQKTGDQEGLRRVVVDSAELGNVVFLPAALATLVLGILLVIDGPWAFDMLWVVLGLVGIAATIGTGIGIIKPRSEEIAAIMERDGMTAEAGSKITSLATLGRIDLVVLYLVVADMALKPTGDDVGVLVVMAVVLIAAVAYFTSQARAAEESAAPQAGAA